MLNYLQPKNLETEAQGGMQDLETRKRIAELMSGIATQQLQAPTSGGVAGRLPGWAPIVQALAGGLAGMQQKGIAESQQNILQQQAEGDQLSLDMLMKARQIQPPKEIAGPPQPGQTMPVTPGSGGEFSPEYKSALLSMIAKGSPRLQPFAKAELEHVNKNMLGPVDLASRATLASIQANPNDPSQWKAKRDIQTAEGSIYGVDEAGGVTHLGGSSYAEPVVINGDLFQNEQHSGKLFKLDNAPKVTVNANATNQAEGSFAKGLGEDTAKAIQGARDAGARGQKLTLFADKLEALDKEGVFSGPTANVQVFTTNLANTLGIPVDEQKLATSEAYSSGILRQVAEMMTASGGVGRSFSDADRDAYLKQFPQLIQSPQGRQRIIAEMRANGQMDLSHAKGVESRLRQAYPEHSRLLDVSPFTTDYQQVPVRGAQKPANTDRTSGGGHWEGQTWVPGARR